MAELEIKPTTAMRFRVFGIVWLAFCFCANLAYLLTGGGSELFIEKTRLTTFLPDGTGVSVKTAVRLSGIKIGNVTGVQLSGRLDPQRAVMVEMRVKTQYLKNIPSDSRTDIGANTLIGGKFIDINEGKSTVPIGKDGVLESEPIRQATDRADLMRAIASDLRQVDAILVTMNDPNSDLGHFIKGEAEYDGAMNAVKGFDTALRAFISPSNELGQALFTNTLYDSLHKGAVQADSALESIQRGEGGAGRVFATDQDYEELLSKTHSLRVAMEGITAGNGNMARMLESDAAYNRMIDALKRLDKVVSDLNAGEGAAGSMMRSAQVYESLNGSLASLAEFLRDFREHPEKYLRYQVFGKKKTPPASGK